MKATKQIRSVYSVARDSEANTKLREILVESRQLLGLIRSLKLSSAVGDLEADAKVARLDCDPSAVRDILRLAGYNHGFSWALEQYILELDCQTIPTLEECFERAERAGNGQRRKSR